MSMRRFAPLTFALALASFAVGAEAQAPVEPQAQAPAAAPGAQASAPPSEAPARESWYLPSASDPKLAPLPKAKPARVRTLSLIYDLEGFPSGRVEGVGHELRLGFGMRHWGISVGTHLPSTRIGIGIDVGRNWGFPLTARGDTQLALMLPTIETRAYFRWEYATTPVIGVGSSLLGLRIIRGALAFDVRLPHVDVWGDPNSRGSAAFSIGAQVAALMAF